MLSHQLLPYFNTAAVKIENNSGLRHLLAALPTACETTARAQCIGGFLMITDTSAAKVSGRHHLSS
jgi:hypothetical protein